MMSSSQIYRESRSILVCDDIEDTRELLAKALRDLGYRVFVADSGELALSIATKIRLHIALIGLNLPDMSGYDVARKIRGLAIGGSMRLVAISEQESADSRSAAFVAGFDQHLARPVSATQILDTIE